MIAAIVFPPNPEALAYDLEQQAREGLKRGLRLYSNGRQFALLPRPAKGWMLWRSTTKPETPPCAA